MNTRQSTPSLLRHYLPILTWGAEYSSRTLANDLIVAGTVTTMSRLTKDRTASKVRHVVDTAADSLRRKQDKHTNKKRTNA